MASGQRKRSNNDYGRKGLSARAFAVSALNAVLVPGTFLDDALEGVRASDLPAADKAFTHALVATALRRKRQLDEVINQFLTKPLPRKSGLAREIVLSAAAQMLFMEIPDHAAINTAVQLARRDRAARHFSGLINAVLRRVGELGPKLVDAQDATINVPEWMRESWREAYGGDTARRCALASLDEAALDITPKSDPAECANALNGTLLPTGTVRLTARTGRVSDLPGYREGAWWVQDTASALPVRLLGDVSQSRVLDLCAAPGGKTAQLAAGGALVTAVDISEARLARIADNLERLDLAAHLVQADAATYPGPETFDAVICDVPCSATGTLRRHPDGLHLKAPEMPASLRPVQLAILENAVASTRPGGRIIYCACSLQAEECEGLIENFLALHGEVIRQPIRPEDVAGAAHLINDAGDLRTFPFHRIGETSGMDGFFAARLMKS